MLANSSFVFLELWNFPKYFPFQCKTRNEAYYVCVYIAICVCIYIYRYTYIDIYIERHTYIDILIHQQLLIYMFLLRHNFIDTYQYLYFCKDLIR